MLIEKVPAELLVGQSMPSCIRGLLASLILITAAAGLIGTAGAEQPSRRAVTVFAASSLQNALEDAARAFTQETGTAVRFSFAASSALARQIGEGAPADLFASADQEWMDYLAERQLIRPESRIDLLGNRLVVVAPKTSKLASLSLTPAGLREALGPEGRIATGEVASVPVGRYARTALRSLGLWDAAAARLAQSENARAALAFVARGEAPLGVVYESDARAEVNVKVVAVIPENAHPPVVYPFGIVGASMNPDTGRFLAFLASTDARPFLEAQGFTVLPRRMSP
jgi:molybdate transport system substrate-binding protein